MINYNEIHEQAFEEHGCTGTDQLVQFIVDMVGNCRLCKNRDENYFCSFLANGTTVQPDFYCAGFDQKEQKHA